MTTLSMTIGPEAEELDVEHVTLQLVVLEGYPAVAPTFV